MCGGVGVGYIGHQISSKPGISIQQIFDRAYVCCRYNGRFSVGCLKHLGAIPQIA